MDKFDALWAYQEEDMKAEAIATSIKNSPIRMNLEKARDFILDRQKQYKQIEDEIVNMADRKDIITQAVNRSEAQLQSLQEQFENHPPQTQEEVRALLSDVSKCRDTIRQYEAEIGRIVKETAGHEKLQRTVRMEAAKAKQNFDQFKADYEAESKIKKESLDAQREKVRAMAADIDPVLLEQYNAIRKHITPPVSRLQHGQCSGCNTSLPSAISSKIKGGTQIECETCGRMIIP